MVKDCVTIFHQGLFTQVFKAGVGLISYGKKLKEPFLVLKGLFKYSS